MTNVFKHIPLKIMLLFAAFILLMGLSFKPSIFSTQEISTSFSQFVALKNQDEYVITELTTNEEFESIKYNYLGDWPIGDTSAELSLVAHYKYFVKLAELKHHIEKGNIILEVPQLYLSTPVAFELSTVREKAETSIFGDNKNEMLDQLKKEVSYKLTSKGQAHVGVVYEKAAKALADNFNDYFKANGFGKFYKSIEVIFLREKSQSKRQFNYNDSFCGKEPCLFELELGKGKIFRVE